MGMLKRFAHVVMRTKAYKAVLKTVAEKLPYNNIVAEYHLRDKSQGGYKRQGISYKAKEIKDWVSAVQEATDPDRPRRSALFRFYQNLYVDDHLQTCIENRTLPLQQASFNIVNKNGEENEELKALLNRPWFHDLMKLFIIHKMQGPTLVRFGDLNELMEISEVEEVPQCNFIAQDGVIIYEEYNDTGVSYKEGALEPYYLQFGNDWSLGMLNELAIIILAKKLGLGSWMSFVEKYGVPPIFAITDRMDEKRRNELFDMLSDFQSNQFAVLQGQEKVEFGKDIASSGDKAFNPLLDRGDRQISRRTLGQTGTTSNEAYVGTAEVHERVEETRHNADKALFMFYFNYFIIPKLIKISPVYAQFANYRLEWDNAEKLTVSDYIKGIVDLGDQFEFDPEEVKAKTGLPIVGVKTATAGTPIPSPAPTNDPLKKKDNSTSASIVEEELNSPLMATDKFTDILDKVAQKIYEQKVEVGVIDPDLFQETYRQLNEAAKNGWGESYNAPETSTAQTMRENLFKFSGAKSYQELQELNAKLFDENGNKRSFNDFKKEVQSVNKEYNENYLNAEYDTAMSSAQMAEKWAGFIADKKLFPNLKYVAINDQRTRPEHAALDGVVKPIDDPFWAVNYPPNGFRCRCDVEQTSEQTTEGSPSIEIDYRFAQNVGKTGTPFVPTHPYFSIPQKTLSKVNTEIELQKAFAPYHKDTESDVQISDFAKAETLIENVDAARTISDKLNYKVAVRPYVNIDNVDNPSLIIKNKLADLSTLSNIKSDIVNALKSAQKQGCEYSVLSLDNLSKLNKSQFAKQLEEIQQSGKFEDINIILKKDKNAVKLSFKDVSKGNHTDIIKKL